MNNNTQETLQKIVEGLKKTGKSPRHVEISQVGQSYLVNVYNSLKENEMMSMSVSTGVANTPELATLKALTEYIERGVFLAESKEGCLERNADSSGFAAFPVAVSESTDPIKQVRQNALKEAIERFVWATWWDDSHTAFKQYHFSNEEFSKLVGDRVFLKIIFEHTPVKEWKLICPQVQSEYGVFIVLAQLDDGGFISGGSCELRSDKAKAIERSLSELFRHSIGFYRLSKKNEEPQSSYDQRLFYFASGRGKKLVEDRLQMHGERIINLPLLARDQIISHDLSDLVAVHYCQFENQPPFLGGSIERLCL